MRRTRDELRALFDEVASVDWMHPAWSGLVSAVALSETVGRNGVFDDPSQLFVTALHANTGLAADTFMAAHAAPQAHAGRAALAVSRARAVASTLLAQDRDAPDQRLLATLCSRGGWLRPHALADNGTVTIAFLVGDDAYLAEIGDSTNDDELARALSARRLRRVDPFASDPTPAAAAVALDPVPIGWARSFHRLTWTEGGGPWMGVADSPPYAVVSTCHAAVDGYVHARVAGAILSRAEAREVAVDGVIASPSERLSPPAVGFAAVRVPGPPPRFANALHAFAVVLDRRLGSDEKTSVPFHVPIAPGDRSDPTRWRRRPLYGLLALKKEGGRLETREMLAARLPAWLAREANGGGVLSRVLHAALTLPLPLDVRRRLIARQPWADRFIPPARVLTGGGYFSWMRFPAGEEPNVPTYPSAVPSFSADRGGAGLSIAPYDGGLAVGLTTSGSLGSASAAEDFLDEWLHALRSE